MNIGLHHFLHTYSDVNKDATEIEQNPTFRKFVNRGVYAASVLGIASVLPQILKIWVDRETNGVSITTWIGFTIGSFFWLFYGIIHKQKPIILTNMLGIFANLSIIVGMLLFGH